LEVWEPKVAQAKKEVGNEERWVGAHVEVTQPDDGVSVDVVWQPHLDCFHSAGSFGFWAAIEGRVEAGNGIGEFIERARRV